MNQGLKYIFRFFSKFIHFIHGLRHEALSPKSKNKCAITKIGDVTRHKVWNCWIDDHEGTRVNLLGIYCRYIFLCTSLFCNFLNNCYLHGHFSFLYLEESKKRISKTTLHWILRVAWMQIYVIPCWVKSHWLHSPVNSPSLTDPIFLLHYKK